MQRPRSTLLSAERLAVRPRGALLASPLPSRYAVLARTADGMREDAAEFLERLVALPLPTWLAIGGGLMADRDGLAVRQGAWADVEAALTAHGLAVVTWRVRDAVETVSFLVSQHAGRWSREARCQFATTHGAAEAAALALLTAGHVRADTVRVLCAPFAP